MNTRKQLMLTLLFVVDNVLWQKIVVTEDNWRLCSGEHVFQLFHFQLELVVGEPKSIQAID